MTHRDLATFQLDDDFPKLYKFKRMLGHHHFHPTKLLGFGVPGSQVVDSPTRWSSTQCCIGKKIALPKKKIQPQQAISFSSLTTFAYPTIPSPKKVNNNNNNSNNNNNKKKKKGRNFRCQQVTGVLCFNNIPMSFLGHCLEVLVSSFATTWRKSNAAGPEWWKT